MKRSNSILVLIASLFLVSVYFFPIWQIDLEAPQYPEGIGMLIHVDAITGAQPQDLNNINGLNHYIGMREISDEMFPELVYMPYIFGFLIFLGLITAYTKKRSLLIIWIILFGILTIAGLVDFYLWAYDYGHNLSADAPIKVPGMTYQPPLLGTKTLLNITATSLPDVAGWLAFGSFGLGFFALMNEYWDKVSKLFGKSSSAGATSVLALVAVLGFSGCSQEPKDVAIALDKCTHCQMMIMDERFASQLVNQHGKSYFFDATECMLAYEADMKSSEKPAELYAKSYLNPGKWINLKNNSVIYSNEIKSPMGVGLLVVEKGSEQKVTGSVISTSEAQDIVLDKWN
jgi:copper chaperone NosL